MYIKKITYTDLDGNKNTEDFYFNLTETEITMLNASYPGGLSYHINQIIRSGDNLKIAPMFENLILSSYGERSADGKRFIKSPIMREEFKQTMAYDALMCELLTDGTGAKAIDFIMQILPKDVAAKARAEMQKTENTVPPYTE